MNGGWPTSSLTRCVHALERLELAPGERPRTGSAGSTARPVRRSTRRVSATLVLVVDAEHLDDVALVDVARAAPRRSALEVVAASASIMGPFLSQSMSSPPHWLLSFLTQPSYSPKSLRKRWYLVSLKVNAGVRVVDADLLEAAAQQDLLELALLVDVRLLLALLDPVAAAAGRCRRSPRSISGCMWRKKKVSSSVRMCEPSTSASVMMMILW